MRNIKITMSLRENLYPRLIRHGVRVAAALELVANAQQQINDAGRFQLCIGGLWVWGDRSGLGGSAI